MLTLNQLRNHFLLAMPTMQDLLFKRSVILMCEAHDDNAVGLIINRLYELTMGDVFEQMGIQSQNTDINDHPVLVGGPVKPDRGFVIHRPWGSYASTLALSDELCVTTSQDIIHSIAENKGPDEFLFVLGYSSWNKGQLQNEIKQGNWLHAQFDETILFKTPLDKRYRACLNQLGINEVQLYGDFGHS